MKIKTLSMFGLAVSALALGAATFDFETGDLQGWKVVDGSFEVVVSNRDKQHHNHVPYVKGGKWFVSTLETKRGEPDDTQVGVIESPTIKLTGPKITFKIGGGRNQCFFALIDRATGKELAREVGNNDQPLVTKSWNVPSAVGKDVFFRIVDEGVGGWCHLTIDDVTFEGTIGAADFDARPAPQDAAFEARIKTVTAAIDELGGKYPSYPAAALKAELAKIVLMRGRARAVAFEALQLRALVKENPLVNANEILYVKRPQYPGDHHNTATIFQCGEINQNSYRSKGALRAVDPKTGTVRDVVPELEGRTPRDPEVDYDGKRIVFSMRSNRSDDYHIYTVNADGTDLKQLTRAKGVSDIDPIFLPDGDILFGSTREPKYCMCNRHIMANLFRMKPDGANIHQIGKSTLFEGHAAVLPDGRILYDRWEYVDRNFGDAQGLWVCNPDGTRHAIYWGNNTASPGGVIMARPLSNPSKVIAVLGSCHDRPWGALGIIDRSLGVDGQKPILRTWPAEFRDRCHDSSLTNFDLRDYINGNEGSVRQDFDSTRGLRLKYADPFPLDDEHFICARMTGNGEEMGLVYFDLHGNEVLFHREAPGCHSPVVLRATKKQPVIETKRNWEAPNAPGRFYVQNVYIGTHMQGIEKGSIKALRIIESPEKRSWTGPRGWGGHGEQASCMNWHSFENKRILGTVPVEEDGSAYFEVPGNTYVYFQALDQDGKMVQSMRSGAYLQPGELYGCVGCHEDRVGDVPKMEKKPLAMLRAPSKLDGSYNLAGLEKGTAPHFYSYMEEVQPLFNKRCVSCHDYGKGPGNKLNLSGDKGAYFNTSYVDLWSLGFIREAGGGPAETLPAKSWGSHVSKLTKFLYGHGKSGITAEERDRVITWMDINAPYWPRYEVAWPENYGGRMPITRGEYNQIQKLCGLNIAWSAKDRRHQREQLNFDRPELSAILERVKGKPAYAEVLKIIQAGKERLKTNPRADMPGFKMCAADQAREDRYQVRFAEECKIYNAIRAGEKIYDK